MKSKLTPLMNQYNEIKKEYRDSILFFQVGDFYETFYEDAKEVSRILNIALTTRDKGKKNPVPLAGVPIHAADAYISRLLQAGRKVVVCEQVEDPSQAKGIVKRAVTDVITPGTTLEPSTLPEKENNFLLCAYREEEHYAYSLLDVSTGEFLVGEGDVSTIENAVSANRIREVILPSGDDELVEILKRILPASVVETIDPFYFQSALCEELLCEHFGVDDLHSFDVADKPCAVSASGALLRYVKELRRDHLKHISNLRYIRSGDFLYMDTETLRNLEIFEPIISDSRESTLIYHIDRTMTAAGSRELRSWLMHPLLSTEAIKERLDGIAALVKETRRVEKLRSLLYGMADIERILSRVCTMKAGPHELLALADSLDRLGEIVSLINDVESGIIKRAVDVLGSNVESVGLIRKSIDPNCPPNLKNGGVIKRGFDEKLDELIEMSSEGKKWIASLQESERRRTGIPSLRVGFNKVFGYYIEVSRVHDDKVPEDYICKQTLVSSQRYITAELKEKENAILTADSRRVEMEREIFRDVCREISKEAPLLQSIARAVSVIDVLSSMANLALERHYCRPTITDSDVISITEGRHPVVEIISQRGFIPNDLEVRGCENQVIILTGPNMGGKSTFIRQVALIVIMAQAGLYVPAARATVGIVDRIFTRVGSSDNLAKGQSTFLVEMKETAKILNNCTSRSLVVMDEVGRGTSTLDGLSIAWAVTEYLLTNERARPKTLFATHYHELTELEKRYSRVQNLRVGVREWGDSVVFLYRIEKGASDRSYGIHVAKMAGFPSDVIKRAEEILEVLEKEHASRRGEIEVAECSVQPSLFDSRDPIRERLMGVDIDNTRPIEALRILNELVEEAKKKR